MEKKITFILIFGLVFCSCGSISGNAVFDEPLPFYATYTDKEAFTITDCFMVVDKEDFLDLYVENFIDFEILEEDNGLTYIKLTGNYNNPFWGCCNYIDNIVDDYNIDDSRFISQKITIGFGKDSMGFEKIQALNLFANGNDFEIINGNLTDEKMITIELFGLTSNMP